MISHCLCRYMCLFFQPPLNIYTSINNDVLNIDALMSLIPSGSWSDFWDIDPVKITQNASFGGHWICSSRISYNIEYCFMNQDCLPPSFWFLVLSVFPLLGTSAVMFHNQEGPCWRSKRLGHRQLQNYDPHNCVLYITTQVLWCDNGKWTKSLTTFQPRIFW